MEKMAGKNRTHLLTHLFTTIGLTVILLIAVNYCNNDEAPSPEADPRIRELLKSLGDNVIVPAYTQFLQNAQELKAKTQGYSDSVQMADGNEAEKSAQARLAWQKAMRSWQRAELMQIGPAGQAGKRVGGVGLRDEIYSWPSSNPCKIDGEIVNNRFGNDDFFSSNTVNAYGLDAVEYLLYYTETSNNCPETATINTERTWIILSVQERRKRRASYAAAAAGEIARKADELLNLWKTGFLTQFTDAGLEGSVYESQKIALNEILGAMFYLDIETKDRKLARPAGLTPDCANMVCVQFLESPYAAYSKEEIIENLKGFQELFWGGADGTADSNKGFNNYLKEIGESDLADNLAADIKTAIKKAEAINGSLKDSLNNDPAVVRSLYTELKKITDRLKKEVITVLRLEIPQEAAGDSD